MRGWVGHVFHRSFDRSKRGVAILVHNKLKFILLTEHKDEEGQVVCIESIINGRRINLCNVYVPNEDSLVYLHEVNRLLGSFVEECLILGGDFNQTLDPVLDKVRYSPVPSKGSLALYQLHEDVGVVDIWRLMNSNDEGNIPFTHIIINH